MCRTVAASLPDYPFLYVRDLSGYDTQEEVIADVFERTRELAPAILVFEEIDGFVNDSNRAVFSNELEGFKSNDGLLVLASSNHPERVGSTNTLRIIHEMGPEVPTHRRSGPSAPLPAAIGRRSCNASAAASEPHQPKSSQKEDVQLRGQKPAPSTLAPADQNLWRSGCSSYLNRIGSNLPRPASRRPRRCRRGRSGLLP